MTNKPKSNRGGPRIPGPGKKLGRPAGRLNKRPAKTKVSLRLPQEIVDRLKAEESYTALIERLLREYYGL